MIYCSNLESIRLTIVVDRTGSVDLCASLFTDHRRIILFSRVVNFYGFILTAKFSRSTVLLSKLPSGGLQAYFIWHEISQDTSFHNQMPTPEKLFP